VGRVIEAYHNSLCDLVGLDDSTHPT
jgi:hypothetical protein